MENLNSVVVEGNLVRDPEIRETPKGKVVANFAVATNRSYHNSATNTYEKEVSFFDVETWAKMAEYAHNECKKGQFVRIVGHLKQNRWEGQDGKRYSRVLIVAEQVEPKTYSQRTETKTEAAALTAAYQEKDEYEMVAEGEPEYVPF